MKHAQNITTPSVKAVPKTASTRGAHKTQGKKLQGNGHSHDELVRLTAYSIYEARQGAEGSDLDDWLRAEAQVAQFATQRASSDTEVNASTRAGLND